MIELDDYDLKILQSVQHNADLSMAELGDTVGLSHTPCWRRVKRLEADGIIRRRVTLLDPAELGLAVTVHVYVTIVSHDEDSLDNFESAVQGIDNIVECYSTSGDKDYVLRVIVRNVAHYEKLLKGTLVHLPNVASINSTFALKQVKYTTELPL